MKLPFDLSARAGEAEGWTKVVIVGHDAAAAQARAIVAPANATGVIAPAALLATPAVVYIASTSDASDDATGVGANSTTIWGLDADGNAQSETITHHATAARTAVVSTLTYSAIQHLQVASVGATGWNVGTIWCGTGSFTAGVPAVGLASIEIVKNRSATGVYTVPAGFEFYPSFLAISAGGADAYKAANVDYTHAEDGIEHEMFSTHVGNGFLGSFVMGASEIVGAGEQVIFRGGATSLTVSLTVRLEGYLRNLNFSRRSDS